MSKNEKEGENSNELIYLSVADEVYLAEMKYKMLKTENQINEIVVQLENLTQSVNSMQQKILEKTYNIDFSNEYYLRSKVDDKNIFPDSKQDTRTESNKKKGKRYKNNKNTKSAKKKLNWVGEVVFYIVLIVMIFMVFLVRSNSEGQPTSFAGYSLFTVLTNSMESEIPQGSLVITKQVSPESLKIGDDITYMANQTTTVTHRIISIVEKYQDTGKRAFQTQGVMNDKPDKNLVPANNVVGKVIFHNKLLGEVAKFISNNWPFLIFSLVIFFVLINIWKWVFKEK